MFCEQSVATFIFERKKIESGERKVRRENKENIVRVTNSEVILSQTTVLCCFPQKSFVLNRSVCLNMRAYY